ncbi:MAG TPA: hypothetical protein VMF69_24890 [Gemmataceae bacterium]|nr:hypothetical protein [Gemmataceae bacterium]
MRKRVVRSLVLACSLLLALPQGWCCLLAMQTAKAATTTVSETTAPANTRGCCPCCPRNADRDRNPAGKPSEPEKSTCFCCPDRDATLPSTSSIERVDTGFIVIVPPLDVIFPSVALLDGVAGSTFYLPAHQLHVLKCVWLC